MSVRVVARLRPLLKDELDKDIIIRADHKGQDDSCPTIIRIPSPKNQDEDYTFEFNSVYESESTQEEIFQAEVAPTIKHLFKGFDTTIFAYGVTGSGKTYSMRGGKSLAERGVIPRLLSGIYRKGRKIEKDSAGATIVEVTMSYYEIYNDRVFDLFEPPEKRTPTGLPLREQHGKTVVVGLTERPCSSLKEFEQLYDQANVNRSTFATKLNAHSSRSHAILSVKVSITTGDETRTSTASAIDLAGSEDNRRTDNGKERMTESASINKSLFVLAQCVEAISKKQNRIPYRESKMTRILSLGQNQGLTVMILNLAPVRSFHLDSLSSLNFANRTKKIEVKEIENQPIFKGQKHKVNPLVAASTERRPLQLLANVESAPRRGTGAPKEPAKPRKAFSVYSDRATGRESRAQGPAALPHRSPESKKRKGDALLSRPAKTNRQPGIGNNAAVPPHHVSEVDIEQIVERKIEEALAARALNDCSGEKPVEPLNEQVQKRLDALEERIERREDAKSEGFSYLLMAKQHHVRGEDASALKMYRLALPYFPDNKKLETRMLALEEKLHGKRGGGAETMSSNPSDAVAETATCSREDEHVDVQQDQLHKYDHEQQQQLHEPARRKNHLAILAPLTSRTRALPTKATYSQAPSYSTSCPATTTTASPLPALSDASQCKPNPEEASEEVSEDTMTPRTRHVLDVINTRDVAQIKLLKGVGAKRAETIVTCLNATAASSSSSSSAVDSCSGIAASTAEKKEEGGGEGEEDGEGNDSPSEEELRKVMRIMDLTQLATLKGVGAKTVEKMRLGVAV